METGHRGNRSPSDTIDLSRPLIVRVLSPPFPVPSLVRILMSLSPLLVSMLAVSVVGVAPITISLLVATTTDPLHLAMTPVVATVTASVSIPAYFPVVHLIFSFLQIITSHSSHPHTTIMCITPSQLTPSHNNHTAHSSHNNHTAHTLTGLTCRPFSLRTRERGEGVPPAGESLAPSDNTMGLITGR